MLLCQPRGVDRSFNGLSVPAALIDRSHSDVSKVSSSLTMVIHAKHASPYEPFYNFVQMELKKELGNFREVAVLTGFRGTITNRVREMNAGRLVVGLKMACALMCWGVGVLGC